MSLSFGSEILGIPRLLSQCCRTFNAQSQKEEKPSFKRDQCYPGIWPLIICVLEMLPIPFDLESDGIYEAMGLVRNSFHRFLGDTDDDASIIYEISRSVQMLYHNYNLIFYVM